MKKLIFIILYLTSQDSFGQIDRKGNGGDVVVCSEGSIELLDFYEARVLRGIETAPVDASKNYEEILSELIRSLSLKFPATAEKLTKEFGYFKESQIFIRGVKLVDVPDSEHIAIPNGCSVEQIAIQRPVQYPEDKFYTINQDLWDKLNSLNKAGLVLHEILFKLGIEGGINHTVDVRYLNSIFFSHKFANLNEMQRFQILANSRQPIFEIIDDQTHYILPVYRWTHKCDADEIGVPVNCKNITEPEQYKFHPVGQLKSYELTIPQKNLSVAVEIKHQFGFKFRQSESNEGSANIILFREEPSRPLDFEIKNEHLSRLIISIRDSQVLILDPVTINRNQIESREDERPLFQISFHESKIVFKRSIQLLILEKLIVGSQSYTQLLDHPNVNHFQVRFKSFSKFQYFMQNSRWQYDSQADNADIEINSDRISFLSDGIKWQHTDGYIILKKNSRVSDSNYLLDRNGDLKTRPGVCYWGAWITPLGFSLEALNQEVYSNNIPKECIQLTADKQFYDGWSLKRYSYKSDSAEFNYYGLGYQGKQDRVYFSSVENNGKISVQGKTLVVGKEIGSNIGLYLNGRPRFIYVHARSLKLKDINGTIKTYKKYSSVGFNLDGLVDFSNQP